MIEYRLVSEPSVDLDVEAAFEWNENERPGLGAEFLDELRASYYRVADGPLKCQVLRSGIRRALLSAFRTPSTSLSKRTSLSSLPCCTRVATPLSGSVEKADSAHAKRENGAR